MEMLKFTLYVPVGRHELAKQHIMDHLRILRIGMVSTGMVLVEEEMGRSVDNKPVQDLESTED